MQSRTRRLFVGIGNGLAVFSMTTSILFLADGVGIHTFANSVIEPALLAVVGLNSLFLNWLGYFID